MKNEIYTNEPPFQKSWVHPWTEGEKDHRNLNELVDTKQVLDIATAGLSPG